MAVITRVSGVTLRVASMARSVAFYRDHLGLRLLYGGEGADFSSFDVGGTYLNLQESSDVETGWGRIVLHTDDVDGMHRHLTESGFEAPSPWDAPWGERYFHLRDPDGHEVSIAKSLR